MDRYSVPVYIRLLVAQSQHLSYFAQLVLNQFLGMALLNHLQMVHQHDPLHVVGHLQRICYLYYRAARIVLSEKFGDAPSTHERWSVHYYYDRRLVQDYPNHGDLLRQPFAEIFIGFLDVGLEPQFLEPFQVFAQRQSFA